jgi:hypothetical protein
MSALGQKPTYALQQAMSALPPIATSIAFFGMSALGHKADITDPIPALEFVLINPPNKNAEYSVKFVHRYLRIVFPFRSPFFFASAAVIRNSARQHKEKKC